MQTLLIVCMGGYSMSALCNVFFFKLKTKIMYACSLIYYFEAFPVLILCIRVVYTQIICKDYSRVWHIPKSFYHDKWCGLGVA